MNSGYVMLDGGGIDLTKDTAQSITGSWARTVKAIATNKPIVAYNCFYGTAPLSPVNVFGWYLASDEIVLVGATLHIHVKDNNTCTVVDVIPS